MRVLFAIHDFLPRHRAGSEIYAAALAEALVERGHEVHVLAAEFDPSRPHGSLVWRHHGELPVTELVNNWAFSSLGASGSDARINHQLGHVLRAVAPDVVHVHNLQNLSLDLPALAGTLGIPSVATVHEYTLFCPSGGQRVHVAERHVCTEIDPERCARCFPQSPFFAQMAFARIGRRLGVLPRVAGHLRRLLPALTSRLGQGLARQTRIQVTAAEVTARLAAARAAAATMAVLVAPSPALGAELVRLGVPADRVEVSDYGFRPLPRLPRAPGDGRVRLGFVGTLVWHKGAHVLLEALRLLPAGRVTLALHGAVDTFPEYTAALERAAADLPVRFAGGFDEAGAASAYASMDVLVVPSLWPENSPLVIHEAFMAGVPVVGARMGGIADLVTDGVNGLLYEADSPAALAAALQRLLDEPELLARLAGAAPPVKTIEEDAREWEARYRKVLAGRRGDGR